MSCTCQECGKQYRVDVIVPDEIWEKIKPKENIHGAGMLCGSCILHKIEFEGEYAAFHLKQI